ncbi:MAG TPA: methylated-DNA--[protein]-cysteine S-methyltransferase [Mycobacteriales bacterium]|jgi:methylated-DNA-[protein]-cysteine S-methyltransferase|nr:methylated-DNA--[protein]-cysteine S-methyltransferase [Mycobacteriales bacterium]
MDTRHAVVETVLGDLTIVATDDAVVGVYFPHHWTKPSQDEFGPAVDSCDDALLETARIQLVEYLAGERTSFDVPTTLNGNEFQQRVWAMLNEIPLGETTTYGELAERLGNRNLAQTVGHAVGHNPLSIIVPCHRVVGKDGKLTGYAGGLRRKQFLLDLEEPEPVKAGRLF